MSVSKYPNCECGECSIWIGAMANDLPIEQMIELCYRRGCSLLNEDDEPKNTENSSGE